MKWIKTTLAGMAALAITGAFIVLFTLVGQQSKTLAAVATIVNRMPTPAAFYDYTGTNSIVIDSSLNSPISIQRGATTYNAYTGTNDMSTNTLEIVNGIVVGVHD